MASKQIYIPPETYVLKQTIQNFTRLNHLSWQRHFHSVLGAISASQDFKYFPRCDYHGLALKLAQYPENQKTLADMLDAFYNAWAESAGMEVARWGDKTPLNAFCLNAIKQAFPEAKFIYTQRPIHDVCASYLKMGRYAHVLEAAERWLDSNRKCLAFRAKNQRSVFTAPYEDMVSEPVAFFESLFLFLNMRFDEEFLDVPAETLPIGDHTMAHFKNMPTRISSDRISAGKRRLSNEDMQQIDDFLKKRRIPAELLELV